LSFYPYFAIIYISPQEDILATAVYDTVEVELQNGDKVTLKPLPILLLRSFMKEVGKLDNIKNEDEAIDIFVNACSIALSKSLPDLVQDREALEGALDVPTIWKILEVCGGIKMGDPNLIAAATKRSGDN
jgi:hypothetical protein